MTTRFLRSSLCASITLASSQPRIDFYNLMNSATIIARNKTINSTFGFVNGIQRGRLIKLGMSFDF